MSRRRTSAASMGSSYRHLLVRSEWWRVVTAAVAHGGLLHLVFTVACLWPCRCFFFFATALSYLCPPCIAYSRSSEMTVHLFFSFLLLFSFFFFSFFSSVLQENRGGDWFVALPVGVLAPLGPRHACREDAHARSAQDGPRRVSGVT